MHILRCSALHLCFWLSDIIKGYQKKGLAIQKITHMLNIKTLFLNSVTVQDYLYLLQDVDLDKFGPTNVI